MEDEVVRVRDLGDGDVVIALEFGGRAIELANDPEWTTEQNAEFARRLISDIIAAERERCAKIAEADKDSTSENWVSNICTDIAASIRKG